MLLYSEYLQTGLEQNCVQGSGTQSIYFAESTQLYPKAPTASRVGTRLQRATHVDFGEPTTSRCFGTVTSKQIESCAHEPAHYAGGEKKSKPYGLC